MDRVFVSYRRSDAELLAAELQPRLVDELDAEVFYDLQSILPGDDWEAEITAALRHCAVFVLLLGRDWAGRLPDGHRRIDADDDILRLEIEGALDSTATVIPVLLGDMAMPAVSELPEGLRRIANLQAVTIDPKHMEPSIDALVAAIRRGLDRAHEARPADSGEDLEARTSYVAWDRETAPATSVSDQLVLAVDAALVTGRPLLLVGATSGARHDVTRYVAHQLGRRYYEFACTERTTGQDFLYTLDQTRRLADAQVGRLAGPAADYLSPGVLWWAFDAESASRRGVPDGRRGHDPDLEGAGFDASAIVMIHHLDRLDPFVAELLFAVLGSRTFLIPETDTVVAARDEGPQVALSVQRIRAVPKWIRRQCVIGRLLEPSIAELAKAAKHRHGEQAGPVVDRIAEALTTDLALVTRFGAIDATTFDDLVKAVLRLGIDPGGATWRVLLDTFGIE